MIPEIKSDLANYVLTVTLARSERKNAITNEMYKVLADTIERAGSDASIRAIVIQADGDTFTAGNDVGEFAAQAMGSGPKELHVVRFLRNLATATVPIVAAVQGKAVGVGTTLLLHCDYVVLAEDAQLLTPFVNLALVPEAGSTLLLQARVGHARAFEMFAFGEPLAAQNALAWGLANKVVPSARLHGEARRVAEKIAAKPRGSLTATKRLMRESAKILAQIECESAVFSERLKGAEAKEAFAAFAQKRQPDFSKVA